jgi:hypothetical protein
VGEEMRIDEVVTQNGDLYKVGQDGVSGIIWTEDGDILVHLQPAKKQVGDRDGWYHFKRNMIIPFHWVAGVTQIAEDGSWAGC